MGDLCLLFQFCEFVLSGHNWKLKREKKTKLVYHR